MQQSCDTDSGFQISISHGWYIMVYTDSGYLRSSGTINYLALPKFGCRRSGKLLVRFLRTGAFFFACVREITPGAPDYFLDRLQSGSLCILPEHWTWTCRTGSKNLVVLRVGGSLENKKICLLTSIHKSKLQHCGAMARNTRGDLPTNIFVFRNSRWKSTATTRMSRSHHNHDPEI